MFSLRPPCIPKQMWASIGQTTKTTLYNIYHRLRPAVGLPPSPVHEGQNKTCSTRIHQQGRGNTPVMKHPDPVGMPSRAGERRAERDRTGPSRADPSRAKQRRAEHEQSTAEQRAEQSRAVQRWAKFGCKAQNLKHMGVASDCQAVVTGFASMSSKMFNLLKTMHGGVWDQIREGGGIGSIRNVQAY
jgi:hypothetical protein